MAEKSSDARTGRDVPRPAPPPQPVLHSGAEAVAVASLPEPEDDGLEEKSADFPVTELNYSDEQVERRVFFEAQRQRKQRLRACERLLLMDYNRLSLPNWPDNFVLAEAQRRRDAWVTGLSVLGVVFLFGTLGLVPAWLTGISVGCAFLLALLGIPRVRGLVMQRPSWFDLTLDRRRQILMAREHIRQLEGPEGLAWRCAELREFNPVLDQSIFAALLQLSRAGRLVQMLRKRSHLRLYLIYLLEAEKAYRRLEKAYLAAHQEGLEKGWSDLSQS